MKVVFSNGGGGRFQVRYLYLQTGFICNQVETWLFIILRSKAYRELSVAYFSLLLSMLTQCRYAKDSYTFLVKYLATFAEEDASTLNEAKEEAVRAVIEFVKSPDMFQVFMLPKRDLDIFNNKY